MPAAEQPPSSNPILSAYLSFVENTPLVTRYVITLASVTYLLSWLVDPSFALNNIPFFTIFQWELYRIVTSPILCNSFLNLIFAYFSFVESGKRLEMSVGSAAFGSMLFLLGTATNISYIFLSLLLFILTKNEKYMFGSCGSIWILILSIIASECSKAPIGSKRRLFVIDVPTLYYPLAILALFTILGGFNLSYLLSVAIGYAHGYDKLVRFQVGPSRITKWESSGGCLINFSKRPGWIYGKDAQGMNAWAGTNQQQQQQQVRAFCYLIFYIVFFLQVLFIYLIIHSFCVSLQFRVRDGIRRRLYEDVLPIPTTKRHL